VKAGKDIFKNSRFNVVSASAFHLQSEDLHKTSMIRHQLLCARWCEKYLGFARMRESRAQLQVDQLLEQALHMATFQP